jgi:hypothetical protein
MTTEFEPWLADLRRAGRLIPEGSVHIVRGLQFTWPLAMSGVWTEYELKADLRLYPDAPGDSLAEFEMTGATFDEVSGLTSWVTWLHPGKTFGLPGDEAGDGVVTVAIEVLIKPTDGNLWARLMAGTATVSGRVSHGS